MFGGYDGTSYLSDTWEYDGNSWREITPTDPEGDGDPSNRGGGEEGVNGLSALAVTTTLSASSSNSNCPDGGVQIDVGVDDNEHGVLDSSEIDQTTYICNGADGADGSASLNGSSAWGINFSNGLNQRWGSGTSAVDGVQTFTFTTPFTSGCSGVFIQRITMGSSEMLPVTECTQTGFTIDRNNDVDGSHGFYYFAVGY